MTRETRTLALTFRLPHIAAESLSEWLLADGAAGIESIDKAEFEALIDGPQTPDYQAEDYLAELGDAVTLRGYFYGRETDRGVEIDTFEAPKFDYALYDEAPRTPQLLTHFEQTFLHEQIRRIEESFDIEVLYLGAEFVEEIDWAERWKEFFHPFDSGERLHVRPTWIRDPLPDDRVVIYMDPGAAFGSGTHESTALCLRLLEDVFPTYIANAKNCKVLDLGCGSGILGIAAAKLGGVRPELIDLDPFAVKQAAANVRQNGLDLETRQGELKDAALPAYDVLLANLITRLHHSLLSQYETRVAPGGQLLLSGILKDDRHALIEALQEHGFHLEKELVGKEWCALLLHRDD